MKKIILKRWYTRDDGKWFFESIIKEAFYTMLKTCE